LQPPAETVNHHLTGAGEFSTGDLGNFQPALTHEQIREIQASLAANIAATMRNNLLTASSDGAVTMREFLLSQSREGLGITLEEAGDIGVLWLRFWDFAQEHPESALAKTFTSLNDALEASSGGERGLIEP
jgi:hypothetical protein